MVLHFHYQKKVTIYNLCNFSYFKSLKGTDKKSRKFYNERFRQFCNILTFVHEYLLNQKRYIIMIQMSTSFLSGSTMYSITYTDA